MRPRISIIGFVRPPVGGSVEGSVGPSVRQAFVKNKENQHFLVKYSQKKNTRPSRYIFASLKDGLTVHRSIWNHVVIQSFFVVWALLYFPTVTFDRRSWSCGIVNRSASRTTKAAVDNGNLQFFTLERRSRRIGIRRAANEPRRRESKATAKRQGSAAKRQGCATKRKSYVVNSTH